MQRRFITGPLIVARKSQKHHPKKGRTRPRQFGHATKQHSSFSTTSSLLTAGIPLDPDSERERQQRLEKMKAQLNELISTGRGAEAVDQMMVALVDLERANERLAWRVMRANRYRFGRNTEKLDPEELQQLVLAFRGDEASGAETPPCVPVPAELEQQEGAVSDSSSSDEEGGEPKRESPKAKRRRRAVAPMRFDDNVEVNETVVTVPEDERCCSLCTKQMHPIKHVRHELIRYVPAKIVVDVELIQFRGTNDFAVPYEGGAGPRGEVVFPGAASNLATWGGNQRMHGRSATHRGNHLLRDVSELRRRRRNDVVQHPERHPLRKLRFLRHRRSRLAETSGGAAARVNTHRSGANAPRRAVAAARPQLATLVGSGVNAPRTMGASQVLEARPR